MKSTLLNLLFAIFVGRATPVNIRGRVGNVNIGIMVTKHDSRQPALGATLSANLRSPFIFFLELYVGVFGLTIDLNASGDKKNQDI